MKRVGLLFVAWLAGSVAVGIYADESLDAITGRSLLTKHTSAVPVFKFFKGGDALGGKGGAGGAGGYAVQAGVVQLPIGLIGNATAANSNSADGGDGGDGGSAVGGAGRKLLTRNTRTVTIPIFKFKGGKAVGGTGGAGGDGGVAVQVGVIQVPVSVFGDSTAVNNNSAGGGDGGDGGDAIGGNGRKLLRAGPKLIAVPVITFKGGKATGGKGGAGGDGGAAGQIGIIQVPVSVKGDAIASNNNSADGGNGGDGGSAVGGAGRKLLKRAAQIVTIPVFKFKGGKAVGGKGGAGGDGGVAVQAGVIQVPISLFDDATAVNNNSADGGDGGDGGDAVGGLGRKLLKKNKAARTVAVPIFKFIAKGGKAVGGAGGAGGDGGFAIQTGVIQIPISVFGDATAVNNNSADGGDGGAGGSATGGNGK